MRCIVTGGAGYIGSKLVTKLINIGHEVTVLDVLKFSSRSLNHLFSERNFISSTSLRLDSTSFTMSAEFLLTNDCAFCVW